MRWRIALVALFVVVSLVRPSAAQESAAEWAALAKGGHVAVIRHGNAPPGFGGDPPGMMIGDCATQRNLDDGGREQARVLGERFRQHGVRVDRIVSSPMCRCLDTAALMAVGEVETNWVLLPDLGWATARLPGLKELVSTWRGPGTLVLVSHGDAIRPLTGILPNQAEIIVVKPAPDQPRGLEVVGRIWPPLVR